MPHFMVRKRVNNPQFFQNIPQTGKRFFYHFNSQGYPIEDNTVINYEDTLSLSHGEFRQLIKNITGNQNPTAQTSKYNYHLPKQNNLISLNYCTNTLGLPNAINGYNLATIGIAANYKNNYAKGNILFIFLDINNPNNEICISMHIHYSPQNTNYLNNLIQKLNQATIQLSPQQNSTLWRMGAWDNFNNLGYIITSGNQEESNYKEAYEKQIGNQIFNLLN